MVCLLGLLTFIFGVQLNFTRMREAYCKNPKALKNVDINLIEFREYCLQLFVVVPGNSQQQLLMQNRDPDVSKDLSYKVT